MIGKKYNNKLWRADGICNQCKGKGYISIRKGNIVSTCSLCGGRGFKLALKRAVKGKLQTRADILDEIREDYEAYMNSVYNNEDESTFPRHWEYMDIAELDEMIDERNRRDRTLTLQLGVFEEETSYEQIYDEDYEFTAEGEHEIGYHGKIFPELVGVQKPRS